MKSSSEAEVSSSKNSKEGKEQPPPYDQLTTIDIDNGTAPLLRETFSGSIFGTSTIVTFELAAGNNPTSPLSLFNENAQDYTFVIRDFLGCVHANGKVANTSPDLNTTLQDVRGDEILHFCRQASNSIEPTNQQNAINRFISRALIGRNKENVVHTFEISKNGMRIGLVKYGDREPTETCLKIYVGNGETEFLVKSLAMGEFVIFRDQSSASPLCNISTEPYKFTGKIIFHPETGITTDEQLLCTASAFAYKTCKTQLNIRRQNDSSFRFCFRGWAIFIIVITFVTILITCLMW